MSNFTNHLLFPSVVSTIEIDDPEMIKNIDEDFELIKKLNFNEYDFDPTSPDKSNKFATDDMKILKKFPRLKKIILDYFTEYKNEVLYYNSVEFDIATSWATRWTKNTHGSLHTHANCVYSGLLYLTDHPSDKYGPLEFYDLNFLPRQIWIESERDNPYTTGYWRIQPKKNLLVFFPSYLMHKVGLHTDDQDRYSLAFNLYPTGEIGLFESSVNIKLVE